jgi:hypothetical protein
MSKKNNNGAPALDLGLEALLTQSSTDEHGTSNAEPTVKAPTTIYTLDDEAGELQSEFTHLAQTRQWGVLVSKAESAIASEEDWEARLWWIRGHLGALSLPVSLLAAPFETICHQLASRGDINQITITLVREIGALMLGRLQSVGDRRQEHGVKTAMQALGLIAESKGDSSSRSQTPTVSPRFELGEPAITQGASSSEGLNRDVAEVSPRGRTRRYIFLLSIVVLGVGGGASLWSQRAFYTEGVHGVSESWVVSQAEVAQKLPAIEARPVSSNLGALYYSLSEAGSIPAVGERPVEPTGAVAVGGAATTAAALQKPVEPRQPIDKPIPIAPSVSREKESVNTNGPIEGQEFRRGVERGRSPQSPRLPEVLNDPSMRPLPDTISPDAVALPPQEVRTVVLGTEVLAAPSHGSRIIARLRIGDRVAVERRIGSWFRIRSKKGKPGFVFAQDLGEPDEFTVQDSGQ